MIHPRSFSQITHTINTSEIPFPGPSWAATFRGQCHEALLHPQLWFLLRFQHQILLLCSRHRVVTVLNSLPVIFFSLWFRLEPPALLIEVKAHFCTIGRASRIVWAQQFVRGQIWQPLPTGHYFCHFWAFICQLIFGHETKSTAGAQVGRSHRSLRGEGLGKRLSGERRHTGL